MCNREISSRRIDRFFSAKLYDHQGPIARGGGGRTTPLTVRVMRNALTGRGLNGNVKYFVSDLACDVTGDRGEIFKLYLKDLVQASPLPAEFFRHVNWLPR